MGKYKKKMEKYKKKIGIIIISIGIVLVLLALLFVFTGNNSSKPKQNNQTNNNEENNNIIEKDKYSGVYELDDVVVKIFHNKETNFEIDKIYFDISSNNDNYNGILKKEDNNGFYSFFDNRIDFRFSEKSVSIKFDERILKKYISFKNGDFIKTREYTINDYYKDNIGDPELFSSKYNGTYELDELKIYVFQIKSDTVYVVLSGKKDDRVFYICNPYRIDEKDDNKLYDLYNETEEYIVLNEDTLEYKSNKHSNLSGNYIKKEKLIINKAIDVY